MSEQTTGAAERSAHVTRGGEAGADIRPHPIVEIKPGVYTLRVVHDLKQRVAKMDEALRATDIWLTANMEVPGADTLRAVVGRALR